LKEGDKVIAGQYLGKVDTSAMAANLSAIMSSAEGVQKQAEAADLGASAAESGVAMAQAAYDQAVRDYERYVKLHEDGVATDAEFERMELGMETSRISVEGAKDQVEAAYAQAVAAHAQVQSVRDQAGQIQVMIGDGTLRAPFGGRISIVFYDPGTVVGPGSPVFKLVGEGEDTGNRLEVHIEVPETIIGSVKAGSPIYLDVASCEEEIQTAVDHLGPEVNQDTRTVEVVAYLDNNSSCLLPGMFGTVRIPLQTHENALLLPETAVLVFPDVSLVYVAVNDAAVKKEVTTGIMEDGNVEILSGLDPNDDVIMVGNRFLTDGAKIEIRDGSGAETPDAPTGTEGGN